MVLTSTSEVYGTALRVPIDEEHPLQGHHLTRRRRLVAMRLDRAITELFGLPVSILRPFNTFGPRQSARAIIPTIISQALTRPVLKLGRLDPRRDLTYVKDTVEGFISIAGLRSRAGTGREYRARIGCFDRGVGGADWQTDGQGASGRNDEQRVRPAKSEVERLLAGTELANQLWGWKPAYSMEQALGETIDWIRSHIDRYRVDRYVDVI